MEKLSSERFADFDMKYAARIAFAHMHTIPPATLSFIIPCKERLLDQSEIHLYTCLYVWARTKLKRSASSSRSPVSFCFWPNDKVNCASCVSLSHSFIWFVVHPFTMLYITVLHVVVIAVAAIILCEYKLLCNVISVSISRSVAADIQDITAWLYNISTSYLAAACLFTAVALIMAFFSNGFFFVSSSFSLIIFHFLCTESHSHLRWALALFLFT